MSIENLVFSAGGGFIFGAVAGYALKKVMKIAAVVIGLFVVGLSYLSYKGWIDVKWIELENATKTTLTNVAGQVGHALNNTASQFAAHSITVEAVAGFPVAAAFGFMPGLLLGLRKG
ncbi:FUN14 domain-containing protein [Nitrososphaera sp. AFS]|uniref:FUN14 domain-containing protein n=1 Tax=Nitrososphaera sp. AFS TaxID=2301191 RepID=UPI00139236E2|nr:FUN14 domain-containing protein [Nitrososphaera sp. AFS]NAL78533.1 hypothetical protein [Nitrososphaera sp. AFS]